MPTSCDLFGWLSSWRSRLVSNLSGIVLEIGVGTGPNFIHYQRASYVRGIEPDYARASAAMDSAKLAHVPIHVDVAPAESLPYPSGVFDHVVSSLVFCSVAEPPRALGEIRRVLKPNGHLHMIEHIQPENPALAKIATAVTPYWRQIAHNCHLDRKTLQTLDELGWQVTVARRVGIFVRIQASP